MSNLERFSCGEEEEVSLLNGDCHRTIFVKEEMLLLKACARGYNGEAEIFRNLFVMVKENTERKGSRIKDDKGTDQSGIF